ncbi:beta strand repeat-containing protein [Frigoriglobus tundricola]|uniref:Alkaline phosphatase n=1 Tax=Frigoriglobus tundricola TaxID=2774151 RepID=A0A6M5YNI2_9BACT|nr:hypothetical protein [Frigoriglobus tundricola]QJW94920.1 hypothetical protein FTUN_2446 [Frigoriglobus tundricola]
MPWFLKQLFGSKTNPIRRPRSAHKPRPRLAIEGLEDRTVPSTLQLVGGALNYTATAGVANHLSVSVSSGAFTITDTAETITVVGVAGAAGSGTHTVAFSSTAVPAAGMVLNLGDMADTVSIGATTNPISVKAGDGDDTIDVGTFGSGSLNDIQAPVTVDGGTGTDTLRINDSASFVGGPYTINSAQVASGGRTVNYTGTENLAVTGGFVGDTFNVQSTAVTVQTTLTGGPNGATFNLGGTDNTLANIRGAVALNGGPPGGSAATVVNLIDEGTGARAYTVQANGVSRAGIGAVSYTGVQQVALDAGSGSDSVTVLATAPGTALVLNMGAGNDVVTIGSATTATDNVRGAVTVNGGDGTDAVVLNDQADTVGNFYGITSTTVRRNFTTLLNYATAESLTLSAGAGNDTAVVKSTRAGTPVTLKMGAGDDVADIESDNDTLDDIQGAVTVDGQAGSDQLTMTDTGATVFNTYTITATTAARAGTATVTYANLENLNVNAGSAPIVIIFARPLDEITTGNQFDVKGTSATTTLGLGSYLDTVAVGSDAGSLDGIRGALNIVGGGSLTLNDQGDNNGNTYTVNTQTVARSGAALISYDLGAPSANGFQGLTINTGAFNDTVNLQTTVGPTVVNTGAGNDALIVGSPTVGLSRTGSVQFDGGAGTDALVLNDNVGAMFGVGAEYDILSDSVLCELNSVLVGFKYAAAESVTVDAGAGDDKFFVVSTAAAAPVVLNGGAGNDTFSVGDSRVSASGAPAPVFANLLGKVTIDGQSGTNTLDYSALSVGIRVDLPLGTASGVAGGLKSIQNVNGSQGNDIIVGDAQANTLFGNGGRDILIGGAGGDLLFGGNGDDILIGDSTVYDQNPAALESLMAEWGRTDLTGTAQEQYMARIGHLVGFTPGGLNGATRLDLSKVTSDGADDGLDGNGTDSAPDWFFLTGTDTVGDLAPTERVN